MRTRILAAVALTALTVAACGTADPEVAPASPSKKAPKTEAPGSLGTAVDPTLPVDFTKCATQTAPAQAKPVSLVFLFDQSGSMSFNDKWPAAKAASRAFFETADSGGVSASMTFFPNFPATDPTNYTCAAEDYTIPRVPLLALPNPSFGAELENHQPNGATPTYVALSGAINFAQTQIARGGDGIVAIVMVTDGLPDSECVGNSIEEVSALAATAAQRGLLTHVIGVGKQLSRLREIASAGGTTNALIVDTQDPDQIQRDLLGAMNQVRFSLACDYALPPPPPGEKFDRDLVNVQFKSQGVTETQTKTFVRSDTCADPNGWRYDNPADPRRILLCQGSCTDVRGKSGPSGEVEILFGCQTKYGTVK